MFETVTPHIDKTYVGNAVSGNYNLSIDDDFYGTFYNIDLLVLIPACYILPFVIVGIVLLLIVGLATYCVCTSSEENHPQHNIQDGQQGNGNNWLNTLKKNYYEKSMKPLMSEVRVQANSTAAVVVCSLFTLSISALDLTSVLIETNADLPSYFIHTVASHLRIITIFLGSISMLFLLIGIVWFLYLGCQWQKLRVSVGPSLIPIWCLYLFFQWMKNKLTCRNYQQQNVEDNNEGDSVNRNLSLLIPIILCIGSTILSLSFHIQNILIAWSTDPVYASRISIFYGILIFSLFLSCKYAYSVPITLRRMVSNAPKRSDVLLVGATITVTVFIVAGIHIAAAIFYSHIPINNAIEESVTGISSIYNSAVLLIGGLIAYNVGWYYFRSSFSFENAVRNAMKELSKKKPSEYANEDWKESENKWDTMTAEERLTAIIKMTACKKIFSAQE